MNMDMNTAVHVLQDSWLPSRHCALESFIRSPVEESPGTMAADPPSPWGTYVPRLMTTPSNTYVTKQRVVLSERI